VRIKGPVVAVTALVLSVALLGACSASAEKAGAGAVTPITELDLQKYSGRWYEIAKFPNRFQADCVANTTADYRLLVDGTLRVINRCQQADGTYEEAAGVGRHTGKPQAATFEVRFAPSWLSWLPFVWGNYWIVDLDSQYSLAAVSEPSREYLWVLSRTPAVSPAAYQALLGRLQGQGFDTTKLVRTPQEPQ